MEKPHHSMMRTILARAAYAAASVAIALAIAPSAAHAQVSAITGVDYLYPSVRGYADPATTEQQDGSFVDLLSISGAEGDVVYVDLLEGDAVLASHLAFVLDEASYVGDAAQASGDYVCMLSMDAQNLSGGVRAFYGSSPTAMRPTCSTRAG